MSDSCAARCAELGALEESCAEDALARGAMNGGALEFFITVLKHVSQRLSLPISVGSKTVGIEVGRHEQPEELGRVMEKWRQVWPREEVRQQPELVMPVAVDEGKVPRDWVLVVVQSSIAGERLCKRSG